MFFSVSIGGIIIHAYSALCTSVEPLHRTDNSNYVAMFMDCICTTVYTLRLFCFFISLFRCIAAVAAVAACFSKCIELEGVAKGLNAIH